MMSAARVNNTATASGGNNAAAAASYWQYQEEVCQDQGLDALLGDCVATYGYR